MKPSLRGKVIDVDVVSEYGGSVYERTVSVRTESGDIDCFEGRSHVTKDDVGDVIDLVIIGRSTNTSLTSETFTLGIEQPTKQEKGRSQWRCTLRGEVRSTDISSKWLDGEYDPLPLIDIGIGTILIEPCKGFTESLRDDSVTLGSKVRIECSRLDIVDRNGQG